MLFDKVFLLSLKDSEHRRLEFFKNIPNPWIFGEINTYYGVDGRIEKPPSWWEANDGAWGCFQSHLNIINESISNNYEKILIFEDDALFCENFNSLADDFFSRLPQDWEQAYIGGQHIRKPRKIINNIAIGSNINRTHAYALNSSGMRKMQRWLSDQESWISEYHIDHQYGILHEARIVVPYAPIKMIVGQRSGYSLIMDKDYQDRWWS